MKTELDIKGDDELFVLLREADKEDLDLLIDYLTDCGKGRVSLSVEVCESLAGAKVKGKYSNGVLRLLIRELQLFGGNSIFNFIRRNGVVYAEIVNDVLDHFGCSYKKDDVVETKELKILEKLLAQAWEKMSAEERSEIQSSLGIPIGTGPATLAAIQTAIKLGGVASYRASLFAANALARSLVGRGLAIGANTTLTRTLGILGGPIGWAVTAIWTAYDFASPAYRITVPCVIQIAYMRQKKSRSVCHACSAINALSSKFCAECGAKLEHGTKNEPKCDA